METALNLKYYFDGEFLKGPPWNQKHERICTSLKSLEQSLRIVEFAIEEHKQAFPTKESENQLLETLADFSMRHHVALARVFGSNKHGFCYLPPQFLLVFGNEKLREVFPHELDRKEVDILDFLEPLAQGEAWTRSSVTSKKNTRHEKLIDKIVSDPALMEQGLKLQGRNVHVSLNFGEIGYVDLVFRDKNGSYLLVEVKVKPEELDKAIGQILRHKEFFGQQNFLTKKSIRMAIACPSIPKAYQKICEGVRINCFEIES